MESRYLLTDCSSHRAASDTLPIHRGITKSYQKTRLYAQTLRHLRPWQVAGRLVASGKRKVGYRRHVAVPSGLHGRLRPVVAFPQHEPWNTRAALLNGRFQFLNRTEDLGHPVDWRAAHMPLLWRYNLHYFHYLHLLDSAEQAALCRSWMAANPVGEGVGWWAYPTSLRIVNWCRADVQAPDVQESLYRQAAHLYSNLETYVGGNHLLENARALVMAGCFFEGQGEAPRWLEKGLGIYRQETPEQILTDGLHFERSPMYHALMLEGYVDVLNVLPPDHPDREWLEPVVSRMTDALASVVHPDGHLALFNDATQEIALPARLLLDYAQAFTRRSPERQQAFPEAGYYIHRDNEIFLMIDGGAVGPDHLLAHAHADVFSYELSVGGFPFVVDTGVYEYPEGPMRQYVRSTAAHNTVSIDGRDQVECWSSFRVARRFVPHGVVFERESHGSDFEGLFAGYETLIGDGIQHRRRIRVDREARCVTVEDEVLGEGTHCVESRVRLHPEVAVAEEDTALELQRDGVCCRLTIEASAVQREEGWYCPRFGVRHPTTVIVLGGDVSLPSKLAYHIRY